ncbi:PilZ domain-containing protein [uncultured Sphingorhabdus sp.]|uniref:PilZ domain-containing protein n=1 Tax=uncultured Sphingorhabdus sp. TaxID=1686106 RepID=UPI0026101921|nr:PilZ domain-containing protein [uncultured Sphingorhabdus sp.]HMS19083.1 PilZ domain-containing protein [Sphingorhabdus sp.]
MSMRKTFGKLGKRSVARLTIELDAGFVLPERTARCTLENVSRNGCRLRTIEPPRIGATILVRVERIEALGSVSWVKGERCGVAFEEPLDTRSLERIRWIIDNDRNHHNNSLAHATAIWR